MESYKAVQSRAFELSMDTNNKEKKTDTMVPFGDLFNHNNTP